MLLSTFSTMSTIDKCGQILLYLSLAIAIILTVIFFIIKKIDGQKLKDFGKYAVGIILGYSICVITIMLFLTFEKNGEIIKELFYPILSILITAVVLTVIGLVISLLAPQKLRAYSLISVGILAIPTVVAIVFLSIYYKETIIPQDYYDVGNLGLILGAIVLALILILIPIFWGKKSKFNSKSIVYAALCIALSFALSYIRIFKLPQGGSITLVSLLPLVFYSKMFGIRKGVMAGVIYGLLQAIQDPWIIHPAQFLLDYPIAFGMIGLSGLFFDVKMFKNKTVLPFILGGILAVTFRYVCHIVSGIFAFSVYAVEAGYGAVAWGFLYNSFALVDMAIALAVGVVMLSSKSFSKMVEVK